MIQANSRNISILAADVLNKYSGKNSTLLEKEGDKYKNALSSLEQNEIYDSLHLDNLHIKAKELFAIQTSFIFNDKEYHTVLQKVANSFKPTKVFVKNENNKLEEVTFENFVNGKNGIYYNVEDLNKFITSLIFRSENEKGNYVTLTPEFISFIKKNIYVSNKINVDNIDMWANQISEFLKADNYKEFDESIKDKIASIIKKNINVSNKNKQQFLRINVDNIDMWANQISEFLKADNYKEFDESIKDKIASIIKKNINVSNKNEQQFLRINVDNIDMWANQISKNLKVDNFKEFSESIKDKIASMYKYLNPERINNLVNTFSNLLEKGLFSSIDAESISKITLADIPTMQRFMSGQLDDEENIEFEARNKMITSFLSKANFEIKDCNAVNYLLSGISNSNVPVFYNSVIFEDNELYNISEFAKKRKEADAEVKSHLSKDRTLDGLLSFIASKDKENHLYAYTYLKIIKDAMGKMEGKNLPNVYNVVENVIKAMNVDARLLSAVYKKRVKELSNDDKKTHYIEVIQNAMLVAKASFHNNLKVAPTENRKMLYNTRHGQKLPIEIFYSPNEQIANFQKTVGIRKDRDTVDTYYGLTMVGITEIENINGKIKPLKMHRFDYRETNFEQLGDIVNKFSKLSNESKLVYEKLNNDMILESKSYNFDIDDNISKMKKLFNDRFTNENGEVFKSMLVVGNVIKDGIEKIEFVAKSNSSLEAKVKAIKEVINKDVALQKLVEVGEASKPDFNRKRVLKTASLNDVAYNKFLFKNKDDLLKNGLFVPKTKYPDYINDEREGDALANKTSASIMLDLQKNIKIYEYLDKRDNNVNEVIDKIKQISNGTSAYDRFINDEQKQAIKDKGILSLNKFIKSLSSLIAAKHTQSIPSNINYWYGQTVLNEYYPKVSITEYENGEKFEQKTTTATDFKQLIKNKVNMVEEAIYNIRESVNNEYQGLKDSLSSKQAIFTVPFELSNENSTTETIENKNENDVSFIPVLDIETQNNPDLHKQEKITVSEIFENLHNETLSDVIEIEDEPIKIEEIEEIEEIVEIEEIEEIVEIEEIEEIEEIDEIEVQEENEVPLLTPFDDIEKEEIIINEKDIQSIEDIVNETEVHDSEDDIDLELRIDNAIDLDSLGDIDIPDLKNIEEEELDEIELNNFHSL